jgi:hypothetical protein
MGPFIIVATDISEDDWLARAIESPLRERGFQLERATPAAEAVRGVRMIALARGRVDAVVLVHEGERMSGSTLPMRVVRAIRDLPDDIGFAGGVKASSVPLLVVCGRSLPWVRGSALRGVKWSSVLPPAEAARIAGAVEDLIRGWRQDLLAELEHVGYAITRDAAGHFRVGHAVRPRARDGSIVAAGAQPRRMRASRVLILSGDTLELSAPLAELELLLDRYRSIARQQRRRPEEVLQRFFERHPEMIYRDVFIEHWARPRLRLPNAPERCIEPDFVLQPRVGARLGARWQVLDIKLPDVQLTVGRRFHPGFSARVLRAVQQLQDYGDYFSRPDTADELRRHFGYAPRNPRLAVLIGRTAGQRDREAFTGAVERSRTLGVELIPYDEILEAEAQRLSLDFSLSGLLTRPHSRHNPR